MYDGNTKSQAFLLFCQGHSFRRIAEILRVHPGCETLTHGTVKSWAETPDEAGHTWSERRREYAALARAGEATAVARTQQEIIAETSAILDEILGEIRDGGLEFKTKDAAVYAFKALAEWQERVLDKGRRISIEDQVSLMLEAMYEIGEVAEVLSKHEKAIMAAFQEKAAAVIKEKHGR